MLKKILLEFSFFFFILKLCRPLHTDVEILLHFPILLYCKNCRSKRKNHYEMVYLFRWSLNLDLFLETFTVCQQGHWSILPNIKHWLPVWLPYEFSLLYGMLKLEWNIWIYTVVNGHVVIAQNWHKLQSLVISPLFSFL